MTLKSVFQIAGLMAVLFTLFPFVAMDYWWIRIFDFPHTQLTILTFIALVLYLILGGSFIFQLSKIYPLFAHYQVKDRNSPQESEPDRSHRN